MKQIYLIHSSSWKYPRMYAMCREIEKEYDGLIHFILPHEDRPKYSQDIIRSCDLVIINCDEIGAGSGIELGWADAFEKPLAFVYSDCFDLNPAVRFVVEHLRTEKKNILFIAMVAETNLSEMSS